MFKNPLQIDHQNLMNRWTLEEEYILYGASKDCVQSIETLDKLLNYKFKFKFIIDDIIDSETSFSNIYKISSSSYQPTSIEDINKRKEIKVMPSKNYFHNEKSYKKDIKKIIITSDSKYNLIKEKLISLGLKEDFDFINYKKILVLWPYKEKNLIHLWRTDILLTEKCTLACTFCNMYMPHYKKPKHRSLDEIKSDLKVFFSKVDYVSIFHIVGGEPLLYPHVNEVINFIGENFRKKIGRLLLTTNGTIKPKDQTVELMKKFNLLISVSDYTKAIKYERKFLQTIDTLKSNNISYFVREDIEWSDFGNPEKVQIDDEKIKEHFKKCTAPYRGLYNGKYFYCHLNTSAVLSNIIKLNENDYVDLYKKGLDSNELINLDLGITKLGYLTFCKNCNGCNTGINIPVSPKSQGLRKP